MNYHKRGLRRLLNSIMTGEVGRLIVTHKDRLLRFGAELVFAVCEAKQVEVVILNRGEEASFEDVFRPRCRHSQICLSLGLD
jgi:predicted site-specific integrase-resolvase